MASSSTTANRKRAPGSAIFSSTSAITDSPTGSIISVVAVLLTHMLRNAVAIMKPPMRASGPVPTRPMISRRHSLVKAPLDHGCGQEKATEE